MIKKYFFSICIVLMANLTIHAQLACQANVNISLGPTGSSTMTVSVFIFGPLNPAHTYTLSKSTFTCADIGTPQMVTVSEFSGGILINSCFSTVNVEDKFFPPVCTPAIACLANLNVSLDPTGSATLTPEVLLSGPPNPAYTYTLSKSTFTCADIGTPQTVTVSEFSGGVLLSSCFTTVNVEDKNIIPACPPPISCRAIFNVSLDVSGIAVIQTEDFLSGQIDPRYTYTATRNLFFCEDNGKAIGVRVSQWLNNLEVNSCISTVMVEDKLVPPVCSPPILDCQSTINVSLNSSGEATLTPTDVLSSPLEPSYLYKVTPSSFNCTNLGSNNVQVSVITPTGFVDTCNFVVVIEDKLLPPACTPAIACLANLNVSLDPTGSATLTPEVLLSGPP
ncbi:MAG: hypothetical protein WAT92_09140, partial [Saprospiraceae bacterium]